MSYNVGIPAAGTKIKNTYSLLAQNFSQLNTQFSVDHVALTAGSDNGEHKQVTFETTRADPVLSGTKGMVYTKDTSIINPADTGRALFFAQKPNATAQLIRQLTDLPLITVNVGAGAGGNFQYIDTPWGLRFMFGVTNTQGALAFSFTLQNIFTFIGTNQSAGGDNNVAIQAIGAPPNVTGLTFTSNASTAIRWLAIGTV